MQFQLQNFVALGFGLAQPKAGLPLYRENAPAVYKNPYRRDSYIYTYTYTYTCTDVYAYTYVYVYVRTYSSASVDKLAYIKYSDNQVLRYSWVVSGLNAIIVLAEQIDDKLKATINQFFNEPKDRELRVYCYTTKYNMTLIAIATIRQRQYDLKRQYSRYNPSQLEDRQRYTILSSR